MACNVYKNILDYTETSLFAVSFSLSMLLAALLDDDSLTRELPSSEDVNLSLNDFDLRSSGVDAEEVSPGAGNEPHLMSSLKPTVLSTGRFFGESPTDDDDDSL